MAESLAQQGTEVIKEFIRNPAARSGFNNPLGKSSKPIITYPVNLDKNRQEYGQHTGNLCLI